MHFEERRQGKFGKVPKFCIFLKASLRKTVPNKCFMVFVGGKYVKSLDDIVKKVESVSEELYENPIIYFIEKTASLTPRSNSKHLFMVKIKKIS